jgi:hypothetical protein
MQAISQQLPAIQSQFSITPSMQKLTWAANKNEANLRLEFGLKGIGVIPAENKHEIGIQRVQSWLVSGQLFFAYPAKRTYEQFRAYRYAPNIGSDGQKKAKEAVFKLDDELPDAVRYAIMAWPHLPDLEKPLLSDSEQARWDALPENSRLEITRWGEFNKRNTDADLKPEEENYPLGDFFQSTHEPW